MEIRFHTEHNGDVDIWDVPESGCSKVVGEGVYGILSRFVQEKDRLVLHYYPIKQFGKAPSQEIEVHIFYNVTGSESLQKESSQSDISPQY